MKQEDLKRVIEVFRDPGTEVLIEDGTICFEHLGDLFTLDLRLESGEVLVRQGDSYEPASGWIVRSLAKIRLLASRLVDLIPATDAFVAPEGNFLSSLNEASQDEQSHVSNAQSIAINELAKKKPFQTDVMYVTSDAGEGKTVLINELARVQAASFLSGRSDWVLVPIPLGGKQFLRFDDISIAALANRYQFPYLHYGAFLELVKMGVIVPAFDGFEEMFVEDSSGEALSAMGSLLNVLDSQGAIVVAARKAYFEFENLRVQEKLFDSISSLSVQFEKIELRRWGKPQFLEYCEKRGLANGPRFYESSVKQLREDHPLLTRPVLVRQLVDVALEAKSLDNFLDKLRLSGADFFYTFVFGIIEREANEKWIDRSGEGDVGTPLMSPEQHRELLSSIAMASWEVKSDSLKREHLEFVTELFCETKILSGHVSRAIMENISGHALLVSAQGAEGAIEFDHDEFRLFFLGEGLADLIGPMTSRSVQEVLSILGKGTLPLQARSAFVQAIKRKFRGNELEVVGKLLEVGELSGRKSFTLENCSWLVLHLLDGVEGNGQELTGLSFAVNAIKGRRLMGLRFVDCYFGQTSFDSSVLVKCEFKHCTFGGISGLESSTLEDSFFSDCKVDSVRLESGADIWDPEKVRVALLASGLVLPQGEVEVSPIHAVCPEYDSDIKSIEKILRYFMRSTTMSESIVRVKLGAAGSAFIDDVLPRVVESGAFVEVENRGGVNQKRFRVARPLDEIEDAIGRSEGNLEGFLRALRSSQS